MKVSRLLVPVVAIAIFSALPFIASAGYTKPKPPTNTVPLDGGLSLLLAAGAGYGIKRIANAKKKNAEL